MFWRFGLHNVSTLDTLLDKEDVALESILDEDDLLQECKAQNTRLIDYFQRIDVLQRLFAYVSGQIEGEDNGRFKYPHVATEVLCSELWCIVETCMNHKQEILAPFWETVLDMPPEEMKTRTTMAGHFAKINAVFMTKKPAEMLAFIKTEPNLVDRLLRQIETSAFVDLLVRIIQLDEQPGGTGVLEWLAAENFMGRLIELLSPSHPPEIHSVVSELIKGIVSMATPSPGAENLQTGFASNMFARNLACKDSITQLTGYIIHDFGPCDIWSMGEDTSNLRSHASSVVHSITVFTELIRKNNSDYFEPYIFHLLRQRLIQVAQQVPSDSESARDVLEQSMKEVVDRMGVVHLGHLLEQMTEHLATLQGFLRNARSANGPVPATIGNANPLTFERFRICELVAELLHCSNMSLLNRSSEYDHLYDADGRLQGGLAGLEELGNAISSNPVRSHSFDSIENELEPALELPVAGSHNPSILDSDEDMDHEPGSSDDDAMEEIEMLEDSTLSAQSSSTEGLQVLTQKLTSSPKSSTIQTTDSPLVTESPVSHRNSTGSDSDISTVGRRSLTSRSRTSTRRGTVDSFHSLAHSVPVGERLKRRFMDLNIMSTLLDLFFEFPWNNFLHSSVYDIIHQILVGVVDSGSNRDLILSLFRDSRLMHRIVEGSKLNDIESAKPKGLRLGYMGHLTLLTEDVVSHLERFPAELRLQVMQCAPVPEWEDYIAGKYAETRSQDSRPLGGGKPTISQQTTKNTVRWKQDDEFVGSTPSTETKGELHRATSSRPMRESSADFGPPDADERMEEDEGQSAPQFVQYVPRETQSADPFYADDDEEDGGWLARSSTFALGDPPLSARHTERKPLPSGFDDEFSPQQGSSNQASNPFNGGDTDAFGPFTDAATADPFSFPSSINSEDMEDSFDSFGDFGDFQSGDDSGELTPTTGSWTFESGSSDESSLDGSVKSLDLSVQTEGGTQTQSGRLSPVG